METGCAGRSIDAIKEGRKQLTGLIEMTAEASQASQRRTSHQAGVMWACVNRQNPSVLQVTFMTQSLPSSAHFMPRHRFEPTADPYLGCLVMNEAVLNKLERRLGRLHAKLRLGIEMDHEAQIFGQGINLLHIENWCSVHSAIRTTLKLRDSIGVAARMRSRSRSDTITSA